MVRLRRIPAVRAANLLTLTIAIPYGIVVLVFVIGFGAFWATSMANGQSTTAFLGFGTLLGAFVVWAFAMAWIWISIAVVCALYNLIAGRLGGIELEFHTIPPES
jgi:hypothetical protein